jgi:hypothetical protein
MINVLSIHYVMDNLYFLNTKQRQILSMLVFLQIYFFIWNLYKYLIRKKNIFQKSFIQDS